MPTKIAVDVASEELIGSFLQLTATHYQGEPINDAAVVRWRHLEAPSGPSTAVELVDGEERVGRMWIQVHPWSVKGVAIGAANPVDFLIREDHRRLTAFMSLFKSTMDEAQRLAQVVFHTTNPLTDDLYRKLMKLKPVTELDGALFPLRPCAVADGIGVLRTGSFGRWADVILAALVRAFGFVLSKLGGVRLVPPPLAAQQEAIVDAFVAEEPVCGRRLAAQRVWRFKGAGAMRYDESWVSRHGRPIGYIVTSDRDLRGIKGRFVIDLILPGAPSRVDIWSMWLQVAALAARQGRHALFFFYNRRNPRLARLGSLPLVTVGRSRLPQRIPVFVRPSRSADPSLFDGLDLAAGYYVLSDFDMF